jgi:hypothetical protein
MKFNHSFSKTRKIRAWTNYFLIINCIYPLIKPNENLMMNLNESNDRSIF